MRLACTVGKHKIDFHDVTLLVLHAQRYLANMIDAFRLAVVKKAARSVAASNSEFNWKWLFDSTLNSVLLSTVLASVFEETLRLLLLSRWLISFFAFCKNTTFAAHRKIFRTFLPCFPIFYLSLQRTTHGGRIVLGLPCGIIHRLTE